MAEYSNAPVEYCLTAYAYSDNAWEVAVVDPDGDAVDLRTATLSALVKSDLRDADRDAVAAMQISESDFANGRLVLTLQAGAVAPGEYHYSLLVRFPEDDPVWAGAAATVLAGRLRVRAEATRDGAG